MRQEQGGVVARDTRHAVAGEPTRPREARGSGEEGGVWSGRRAHPTHRPHTRGEDARSRAQPLKSTRDTACIDLYGIDNPAPELLATARPTGLR